MIALRSDVVALFVDPRGPYPKLVTQWYDAARDATTYAGSLPVVAHPPCGPWGRLRHLSKHDNPEHALWAVDCVRRVGGALEHPAYSLLWKAKGLPRPGELPDAWGGVTIAVSQCDWGHVARKPTWLYLVGLHDLGELPAPGTPTHWISGSRDRRAFKARERGVCPPGIKMCSAQQRRRTPIGFAKWLLELASGARVVEEVAAE